MPEGVCERGIPPLKYKAHLFEMRGLGAPLRDDFVCRPFFLSRGLKRGRKGCVVMCRGKREGGTVALSNLERMHIFQKEATKRRTQQGNRKVVLPVLLRCELRNGHGEPA